MHRLDTALAPPRSSPVVQPLRSAQVGCVVDMRYRLVREIASGAGGAVFEAEHVHTRTRVALKTAGPSCAAHISRTRFLREARSLGLCQYPHIVSVHDAGECQRFGPYIALALIEGRTLSSFITARARLDAQSTVAVLSQIGGALSALDKKGIVHRNIKPANVLIVPSQCGEADTAVLIDFGESKIKDTPEAPAERFGPDNDITGTPEYMAPEQLSARDAVDHRTDVYGLGALAYECLTGATPFCGSALSVVSAIVSGKKPRPISDYRSDIPPALEAAVLRALSGDPAARWQDATAFSRACSAAIGGALIPLYLFPRSTEAIESQRPDSLRRKAARAPYQAPARILMGAAQGYDARIEDISPHGILLVTAAELIPRRTLLIRFPLPMSGRVVTLDAEVRWTRPRKSVRVVGLQFSKVPADALREIEIFSASPE